MASARLSSRSRSFGWESLRALLAAVGLFVGLAGTSGCRAIRQMGESRQSLTARRLSREGMEARRRGQTDLAERLFTDALAVSDADDRAHRGLAETLWERGEKQTAINHMRKAIKLSAADPRLVNRLGEMYLDRGQLTEAENQSNKALTSDRNSAEIWTLQGDCLWSRGESEQALAAYHRALAIQPDYVQAKLKVAEIYLDSDRYDRLLATLDGLESSLDENGVPTRVHMLRGIAMKNLGRSGVATRHFAKAVKSDPARAEPHLQMADIEWKSGRADSARESIRRAMELDEPLVLASGWAGLLDPGRNETTPSRIATGVPNEGAEPAVFQR